MSSRPLLELGEPRRSLSALYESIAAELASAETIFQKELGSRFPFVQHLVDHCADFQGKRLRPALVLLSGQACGTLSQDHSVLGGRRRNDSHRDSGARRHPGRGRHSPPCRHGQRRMGQRDSRLARRLFIHACISLAASLEETRACRWIGAATNKVCEGEMQQVHHRGNLDLDEDDYFAIIEGKTAELTAVSCRLGAFYAGAAEPVVAALDRYGRNLGIAFQIADDVLDIWGEERATGKSLGTDLEKQKLTLPVIRLLSRSDPEAAAVDSQLAVGFKRRWPPAAAPSSGRSRRTGIRLAVRQAAREAGS